MRLNEFQIDPETAYIYLERYVNDGSPSGHSDRSTSLHTAPKSSTVYLELLEVELVAEIEWTEIGENTFLPLPEHMIVIHPDMIDEPIIQKNIKGIARKIKAYPTATGRTLKIAGREMFVKLTYNRRLGRMERQIAKMNIVAALQVSAEICKMLDHGEVTSKSAVLKEKYGRVAKLSINNLVYEWGFVFREYKPYPYVQEAEFFIPCFSLFSVDIHIKDDLPLLIQLFRNQGKDLVSFLLDDLILPIYDTYFNVLTKCGIGLEAHAQNILITIDERYQIRRIVVRDLESAYRDIPLRELLGIKGPIDPACYKCIYADDYNYQIMHSFMFDFKLGEYLISPILECINKYYPINLASISNRIKKHNRVYIDLLPKDYFPISWYDYEKEIFEPGQQRPYIAHEYPKYR